MRPQRPKALLALLLLGAALSASAASTSKGTKPRADLPGREAGGVTLLPNGWRIAPAGRHLTVGDLPLAMAESADGRMLVVTNNGYEKPTLTVVDLDHLYVRQTVQVDDAWLGLAWHPDGKRLYASGGGASSVGEFRRTDHGLEKGTAVALRKPTDESFVGGLAISPDGARLFAVQALGKLLSAVDLGSGKVVKELELPAEGYTTLVTPDGGTLLVSLWGGAKVLLFDAATLEPRGEIAVGEHPNSMALSKDGRLFVACANTNAVWVVDLASRTAKEQISIALAPGIPPGSTPNAVSLSPDGRTLLVANADNNTVAVVDISRPGASAVSGFLPTGWYPTAAQFSRDGKRIFVLSGKGLTSAANPKGSQPGIPGRYIAELLQGSLSILPVPDAKALAAYTHTVYRLTPALSPTARLAPAASKGSPIPVRPGGKSPIRHVFYIIRENRTYDQILGDLPRGNGDPNLCLFGEEVTPNAHALVRDFVLLDNFYVNAEVSYSGHAFSTGAYSSDFVEKVWPMNYANRGGDYLSEGGGEQRNPYGNITAPKNGYLWDACNRAGVSVRSYGEFVDPDKSRPGKFMPSVPGLKGRIDENYPNFDLTIPDNRRVDLWLQEFRRFEAGTEGTSGELPRLSILRLGGDHTQGTRSDAPTPRAMIAENDLALGRVVETIAKSRFWKESAIFIVEDDAQNGPDHVDAHRSVALVVSPYTRRHAVDSTLYTTAGVLRTMELILGLPPMSQYDATAAPLFRAFQSTPDLAPFLHREARISIDEKNGAMAWGAAASQAMNLEEADVAPELELNEILWKSVRGAASPMPPPVHAAFVRPVAAGDGDE